LDTAEYAEYAEKGMGGSPISAYSAYSAVSALWQFHSHLRTSWAIAVQRKKKWACFYVLYAFFAVIGDFGNRLSSLGFRISGAQVAPRFGT
jgi:hypothetical protein